GSAYSVGTVSDVQYALGKASRLLLIPVLISLRPEREYQERALRAFKAAVVLTLVLSFLVWLGLTNAGFVEHSQINPVVFRLKITHSVLMSFGAFAFALQAREAADWRSRMLPALLAGLAAFNVFYMVPGRTGQVVLLALLLYFFFSWLRWRGLLVAAAAGATIAGTAYLAPSSAFHQRVQTTIGEISDWRAGKPAQLANMRLEAWSNSVEIVKSHPLVGAGTGGFAAAYARQVQGTSMMPLPQPGEPTAVPAAAVLRRAAFQDALAGRAGHDLRRGDRAAFPRAHQAAARRRVRLVGRAELPARGIRRGDRRHFSRARNSDFPVVVLPAMGRAPGGARSALGDVCAAGTLPCAAFRRAELRRAAVESGLRRLRRHRLGDHRGHRRRQGYDRGDRKSVV